MLTFSYGFCDLVQTNDNGDGFHSVADEACHCYNGIEARATKFIAPVNEFYLVVDICYHHIAVGVFGEGVDLVIF
jgi:hypothetical protein